MTTVDSGTVTTDGSLQTLTTQAINGIYQLAIDCAAMAAGDAIELTVTSKVLSGGTEHTVYFMGYQNVQATPIKYSVPIASDIAVVFKIKRTAGTDRAYPWKVMSL